jgi:cytochrome c peroxidase
MINFFSNPRGQSGSLWIFLFFWLSFSCTGDEVIEPLPKDEAYRLDKPAGFRK